MQIRPAEDDDRRGVAELFAAVAEERDGIAAEPPVDLDRRAASLELDGTFIAVEEDIVGALHVDRTVFGFGELWMLVARHRRGHGVGSALMNSAIEWSRAHGLHKLTLSVFPHNEAALALYRKFGFVEEGLRVKQIRRSNGELWDLVEMGLLL